MRSSIRAIVAALAVALILPAVVGAAWPVATRDSWISQAFKQTHKADDIAAAAGTPVVPMKTGKVIFAGWKSNCGGNRSGYPWDGCIGLPTTRSRPYPRASPGTARGLESVAGGTGCASAPTSISGLRGGMGRAHRVNPWATSTRGITPGKVQ